MLLKPLPNFLRATDVNGIRPANYTEMRCGAAEEPDLHAQCSKNRGWMTGLRTNPTLPISKLMAGFGGSRHQWNLWVSEGRRHTAAARRKSSLSCLSAA